MPIIPINKETETVMGESCARLYCRIFSEPPWNETGWTAEEVLSDMQEQTKQPGFCGFMAAGEDDEVIGFTWGYLVSVRKMRSIAGHCELDILFEKNQLVFYVDELGVGAAYRGRGIGSRLSRKLVEAARNSGAGTVALRTDRLAQAARGLYLRLDFHDLGIEDEAYPDRTYWCREL